MTKFLSVHLYTPGDLVNGADPAWIDPADVLYLFRNNRKDRAPTTATLLKMNNGAFYYTEEPIKFFQDSPQVPGLILLHEHESDFCLEEPLRLYVNKNAISTFFAANPERFPEGYSCVVLADGEAHLMQESIDTLRTLLDERLI